MRFLNYNIYLNVIYLQLCFSFHLLLNLVLALHHMAQKKNTQRHLDERLLTGQHNTLKSEH